MMCYQDLHLSDSLDLSLSEQDDCPKRLPKKAAVAPGVTALSEEEREKRVTVATFTPLIGKAKLPLCVTMSHGLS